MVLANSPAGVIEPVENLKRRKLAVYWRPHTNPDGETVWMETRPLPVDPVSKEIYLSKGFRLTKPSETPELEPVNTEKEALAAEVARLTAKVIQLESVPKTRKRAKSSD